jgi:hypothetical protein
VSVNRATASDFRLSPGWGKAPPLACNPTSTAVKYRIVATARPGCVKTGRWGGPRSSRRTCQISQVRAGRWLSPRSKKKRGLCSLLATGWEETATVAVFALPAARRQSRRDRWLRGTEDRQADPAWRNPCRKIIRRNLCRTSLLRRVGHDVLVAGLVAVREIGSRSLRATPSAT